MVIRALANAPLHGVTHAKVYTLPAALWKGITALQDECTTIVVAEEVGVARKLRDRRGCDKEAGSWRRASSSVGIAFVEGGLWFSWGWTARHQPQEMTTSASHPAARRVRRPVQSSPTETVTCWSLRLRLPGRAAFAGHCHAALGEIEAGFKSAWTHVTPQVFKATRAWVIRNMGTVIPQKGGSNYGESSTRGNLVPELGIFRGGGAICGGISRGCFPSPPRWGGLGLVGKSIFPRALSRTRRGRLEARGVSCQGGSSA